MAEAAAGCRGSSSQAIPAQEGGGGALKCFLHFHVARDTTESSKSNAAADACNVFDRITKMTGPSQRWSDHCSHAWIRSAGCGRCSFHQNSITFAEDAARIETNFFQKHGLHWPNLHRNAIKVMFKLQSDVLFMNIAKPVEHCSSPCPAP